MRKCKICGDEFNGGGFLILESELYNGKGLVVMNSTGLSFEFKGDSSFCGQQCALEHFSAMLDEMQGVRRIAPGIKNLAAVREAIAAECAA
jgi:hypothetical protein